MSDFPTAAFHLKQEYNNQKVFYENQPIIVQRFLESQGQRLAEAITSGASQVRFFLPDKVLTKIREGGQFSTVTIPETKRQIQLGGFWDGVRRCEVREAVLHCLQELEQSPEKAVSASAYLLRFSTATYMIFNMLPTGRSVVYRPDDDEVIPSIPVKDNQPESAITQTSDAITEEDVMSADRGELQTPFVPFARKFYLPQWVAFDQDGKLLVGSENEADAYIQSMQKYVQVLHRASSLAPYMVASSAYQRKRYGILGQLINQGRALASFKTKEIIRQIQDRAQKGNLNRGLSISLPYFDDQHLVMAEVCLEVIPAGRIMFVPAFVVRAVLGEQAKVSQDTRLSSSTRKHLLNQLKVLEESFQSYSN
jgi:hypothetical protein